MRVDMVLSPEGVAEDAMAAAVLGLDGAAQLVTGLRPKVQRRARGRR
jgi:hypothetical protein